VFSVINSEKLIHTVTDEIIRTVSRWTSRLEGTKRND